MVKFIAGLPFGIPDYGKSNTKSKAGDMQPSTVHICTLKQSSIFHDTRLDNGSLQNFALLENDAIHKLALPLALCQYAGYITCLSDVP